MRRRVGAVSSTILLTLAAMLADVPRGAAADAPPDAPGIIRRMKAAMEPSRPSVRTVTLRVSGGSDAGSSTQVVAGEVRKKLPDGSRILIVVRSPQELRGMALLVQEASGPQDLQWLYIPAIGRVRKILSSEACVHFLNSDFTYADLGFVSMRPQYKLIGEVSHDGTPAWEIQEIPHETWCYSSVTLHVAKSTYLPLERRFFDPAGALWKVERWHDIVKIDGVPTPVGITMEDVQAQTRSDITLSDISEPKQVDDTLFEPGQLPRVLQSPVWNSLH